MNGLDYLFKSIKVNELYFKNRILFPPIGTCLATKNNIVSKKMIRHYEDIAKGGTAGIIVEFSSVDKNSTGKYHLGIYDDKFIPKLLKLSQTIKIIVRMH